MLPTLLSQPLPSHPTTTPIPSSVDHEATHPPTSGTWILRAHILSLHDRKRSYLPVPIFNYSFPFSFVTAACLPVPLNCDGLSA